MAKKLPLTLACGDYEIVRALKEGSVQPDGIELTVLTRMDSTTRHWRFLRNGDFDVAEASASAFITAHDQGRPFVRNGTSLVVTIDRSVFARLKKAKQAPEPPRYILRPYRYLADPRRTAKGKPHMVLALHARGGAAGGDPEADGLPAGGGGPVRRGL